ncbi:MAG: carbamoyltransferase [Planctomycetes bacterium]|nr:carbamoyltransferase [Planctomycetota bacterium]
MTAILGISAFYHDSAAALVVDGRVVAAAQEERFTRVKHDHEFPKNAVEFCLRHAGIDPADIDAVGFYDKPLLKFERLLETYLATAPRGFASFAQAMPLWLKQKLFLPREIRKGLTGPKGRYKRRVVFVEHHESHAASAFFPSPFDEAAVVTLDGVGEWAAATIGKGEGNRVTLLKEQRFPHSLGLLYSAFTYFTGFRVNSGEYKLMGLAPYGEPRYEALIREKLIDLREDGSFRLNMDYFTFPHALRMTGRKFAELFGGPERSPEAPLTQREMDIAASIQRVTEEVMLRTARHALELTGSKNLCLAGGVALNCVGNGRILRESPFERIWVQPAAGDAGGALGVALFTWHQLLGNPRTASPHDSQEGSRLGPAFTPEEVESELTALGARFTRLESDEALVRAAADHLTGQRVVGWFQGRMEFGPRALGGRSILGDARSPKMQSEINLKTKFREGFRPFAPIVLEHRVREWFDLPKQHDSPYMLIVAPVAAQRRVPVDEGASGLDKLRVVRSSIPAVTHVDHSARVQTVDQRRDPLLFALLTEFEARTGCPVLINTSFNVRSEPIVCTPGDAYRCFMASRIDTLFVGRCVLRKEDQPDAAKLDIDAHLAKFIPD